MVPGCLRRESEERETWTAESLRAAFRSRSLSPAKVRLEETLAVDVSGQHYGRLGEQSLEWSKWDLVNGDAQASSRET